MLLSLRFFSADGFDLVMASCYRRLLLPALLTPKFASFSIPTKKLERGLNDGEI